MDPEDLFTPFDWISPLKAIIEQDFLQKTSDVATDSYDTITYLQGRGIKCTNIQHSYIIGKGWLWMFSVPRKDEERVRQMLEG